MRRFAWFVVFICCLMGTAMAAPTPVEVTLNEYLGTDWQDELVHYRLTFAPGELAGIPMAAVQRGPYQGEDAQVRRGPGPIPSQISDIEYHPDGSFAAMSVWFKADLPADGEQRYTIRPGVPPATETALKIASTATRHELTAAGIGIALPAGGATYDWPVPATDVPGPIQALHLPSGKTLGPGRFEVPFLVKSWQSEVLASGPLFAEVRVTYTFDVGYWQFTARVIDGSPMIVIEEEFDTGYADGIAWDAYDRFYTLPLASADFAPTQVFYGCANNDRDDLQDLLKNGVPESVVKIGTRSNWFASTVRGYSVATAKPGDHFYFSGYQSVLSRIGGAIRVLAPGGDAVGLVALKTGFWRNGMSLRCRLTEQGEYVLSLPLQVYEQEWASDGYSRYSPNYTGKTLYVPDTTARRTYGIVLSPAEDETTALLTSLTRFGSKFGAFPLDEVKAWTLDWPDPMADAQWTEQTSEEAAAVLQTMRDRLAMRREMGNLAEFSMAYHYGYAKGRWGKIKAVIDDPTKLSKADRIAMRRLAAWRAYDMHSLNTFPWGTGFHLNNPNMSIMALEARAKSSVIVKDHPQFRTWGEWDLAFMQDYIRRFTRESGALYENAHYSLGVTLGWAADVNAILMEAGIGDAFDTPLFRKSIRFTLDWLTPPDLRYGGHRVVLPFGNCSYQSFPPAMATYYVTYLKDNYPELASQLQWAANQTLPEDQQLKLVESIAPPLTSTWYKDYGVYFRHGFGTPHETLLFLYAGNCDGHYEWELDQMSYTLYGKGQPINLHFGNGYFPMFGRPWLRNRVSIDHMVEKSERNPTRVEEAVFSPEVEYCRATRGIDMIRPLVTEYPLTDDKGRTTPEDRANWPSLPEWQQIPMTVWSRQIVFVKDTDPKGPNYFVLHDAFSGTPTRPTDLSLWFLANAMEQPGNDVFHFVGQLPVDLDLFLHTPAGQAPETGEFSHINQPYVRLVNDDMAYYPDGKRQEKQLFVRWKQPAGKDYLVVLYPRLKENDPPATFTRLADHAVKVETSLSTDYVFVSAFGTSFRDEQVAFEGMAGTVRFYRNGQITVINTEGQATITVDGRTIVGHGPFRVGIAGRKVTAAPLAEGAEVKVE